MSIICITSILLFPLLLIQCTTKENKRKVAKTPTPPARSRGGSKFKRNHKLMPSVNFHSNEVSGYEAPESVPFQKASAETPKTPSLIENQKTAIPPKSSLKRSVLKREPSLEPTQNPIPVLSDTQKDESTARPITTRRCSVHTARKPPKREEYWNDQNEDDTLLCVKSIE